MASLPFLPSLLEAFAFWVAIFEDPFGIFIGFLGLFWDLFGMFKDLGGFVGFWGKFAIVSGLWRIFKDSLGVFGSVGQNFGICLGCWRIWKDSNDSLRILGQICECFRLLKDFQGIFEDFGLSWAKFWDLFGMLKDVEGFEGPFEDFFATVLGFFWVLMDLMMMLKDSLRSSTIFQLFRRIFLRILYHPFGRPPGDL